MNEIKEKSIKDQTQKKQAQKKQAPQKKAPMKQEPEKKKPEKQTPEPQAKVSVYRERLLRPCRIVLGSKHTQIILLFLCLTAAVICLLFIFILYGKLDRRLADEAERNAENLALLEKRLMERADGAEQNLLTALDDSTGEIRNAVRRLDATYMELLDAQKRRTLESLYAEDILASERKEAEAAFRAGRYPTANRLYREIAAAHQDDQEARFFLYYSLFLINKMERDNYRIIADAMNLLEKQGYTRREITETLNFIAEETGLGREKP